MANLPMLFPIPTLLSIFDMIVEACSDGIIKGPCNLWIVYTLYLAKGRNVKEMRAEMLNKDTISRRVQSER